MGLKKVLTLRTIVATSAGLTLATSTFVAAVQVAGFLAGNAAWLAILTSGLLCFLAAACFSELNGQLPSAAGIRLYFGRAFNDNLALVISLFYMAVVMGIVGAESFILARVLSYAMPAIPPLVWIIVMFVIAAWINIRGVKIAGNFQDIITYGLMLSIIVLVVLAFGKINFRPENLTAVGGPGNLIQAVALGVFIFVGFEWVTPLAEESTDTKLISKGMLIAVGLLSIVYALFAVAVSSTVPKEALKHSVIPHLLFAENLLGKTGVIWMTIICLGASITTFNAGLLSVSRFLYASAREHVLPTCLSKVSLKYFTPWAAILTIFFVGLAISIIVLITKRYLIFINIAAAMESLIYVLAGLAVIKLRQKTPADQRPYTIPGGIILPGLTVVVFAVLMVAVLITDKIAGLCLAAGLFLSWVYVINGVPVLRERHRKRHPVRRRRPVKIELEE
ncbi:amino acid transporter [Peptococcaceae bacterium SCADC1_2_3]|jgi:amino acid transporter|nr:amino acid transporter [Peptococcaceae bacterium SCADC1_2_3]KFI36570.1 amino acid transporter [Peptococcaceae bacterium SCADC1_2_3]KFI37716.1 amino acid transporter [Peptococcaceae bacterium SCADC1_2_3]